MSLVLRAQSGDASARDELVLRLMPLVHHTARRYRASPSFRQDLVQEGVLGVLHALEKFDATRGVSFGLYARYWIRSYVGKHAAQRWSVVRTPYGAVTAHDDAASEDVEEGAHCVSADDPSPEDHAVSVELVAQIRLALRRARVKGHVGKNALRIIHQRILSGAPRTLDEIGAELNCSREAVRQSEARALRMLRGHLASWGVV